MSLKILFLSHKFFPDIGGIETVSEILAYNFSKAGHEVHMVTWSPDETGKVFPFKVIRNPGKRRLFEQHAWADVRFENNPCLRLSWPALFFRRPSVVGLHTWIDHGGNSTEVQSRLKFWWLKRAKKVIACSEAIRKGCYPESITINNPYLENKFKVLPDIPRTSDFVFVGRLVSDKGVDIAIQAFHHLLTKADKIPADLSLTIIGDGPERKNFETMVSELGLKKNIEFRGALYSDALVACLNQHRFILVPSVWEEPFGLVALEGMACGCLPIVSDGGGLPDAVGKAGLVFRRGDVHALVECIQTVLNDQELEKKLRDAVPEHLEAHCSEAISMQYLSVIESVIQS